MWVVDYFFIPRAKNIEFLGCMLSLVMSCSSVAFAAASTAMNTSTVQVEKSSEGSKPRVCVEVACEVMSGVVARAMTDVDEKVYGVAGEDVYDIARDVSAMGSDPLYEVKQFIINMNLIGQFKRIDYLAAISDFSQDPELLEEHLCTASKHGHIGLVKILYSFIVKGVPVCNIRALYISLNHSQYEVAEYHTRMGYDIALWNSTSFRRTADSKLMSMIQLSFCNKFVKSARLLYGRGAVVDEHIIKIAETYCHDDVQYIYSIVNSNL